MTRIPISFRTSVAAAAGALAVLITLAPALASGANPDELALWNDPAFQRRFVESYIAETEIEPRVTVREREQMEKVLELIAADDVERAVRLIEKNRGEAASAVFDFTLANLFFQQDKLPEAAELYRIAVDKYPSFRRAWRNLGVIYSREGDYEKARPALTRVIELGGADAITYGLLGYAYASTGEHLAAESAYRMAILLDPGTMDWQMGLVLSLYHQQRYAELVTMCDSLIARQPDRHELWLLQANGYIGLGKPLRAAENFELVDRLGHSTPESLSTLGDIYTNEEIYDLAVNSYVRALEIGQDAGVDRALRAARVLTARGAHAETRRLLDRIESLRGDRLGEDDRKALLKLRARIAVAEGAGEEEAKVLEEIVAIDPLDGEALILLGQHASRAGETEKAVFYYERAASLEGFEADAKTRHAQLLVSRREYKDALPLLRRAQDLKPRESVQKFLEQVERLANATR